MNRYRAPAITLLVVLLLGIVVNNSVLQARTAVTGIRTPIADSIGAFDSRLAAVKADLPKRGTVGYLTDHPEEVSNYYGTQFALTPLVVANSPGHDRVIAIFLDAAAGQRLMAELDLRTRRNYGGGLMLLEPRRSR